MNTAGQATSADILAYLAGQQDFLVVLLQRLTLAESPSDVPGSQGEIREIIATELEKRDFAVKRVPGRKSGGMLHARPRGRDRKNPAQMILGHYDTVWPIGTLAKMPFECDGEIVRGPGVFDMKGGVVQALMAIDAIRHFELEASLTTHVFLNSDEEIGSRESRRYIEKLAPGMDRVFVLEPSLGPTGKLKTTRKGIGRFTITVSGEAAHAGLDPGTGASAILELSHVIQELFALNDLDKGITVNVGTIDGGLRPNVVAPRSEAVVDVRVAKLSDAKRIEKAIRCLQPVTPGTTIEVEGLFGRPAMEQTPANRELWRLACKLGEELGIDLAEGMAGGGSDGNFTSLYTATLDGMGAVGDGAHARHEHLRIQPTIERAALLTLLLLAPPLHRGGKEAQ